ncbi:MAG TPA: response regulator transcription factor [Steroidobacteraceae bacterium]|nr:response regulator transcription factor [Steroidobacteraceae bacterium]
MRVLLLEDHGDLRRMVADYLSSRGFAVDAVSCGGQALTAIRSTWYDALILDLGLPDMDGMEVLAQAHGLTGSTVPALILTARDAVGQRVQGLNAGADDYLVKPFDLTELEARLRAVLRRPGERRAPRLTLQNLSLDTTARRAEVDGVEVDLARREMDCLEVLLRAPDRVVVRDVLEERLYSSDEPVTPNALEALISRLRRKLTQAHAAVRIETRRGIGYRLRAGSDS